MQDTLDYSGKQVGFRSSFDVTFALEEELLPVQDNERDRICEQAGDGKERAGQRNTCFWAMLRD